jgi:hypothetical protein
LLSQAAGRAARGGALASSEAVPRRSPDQARRHLQVLLASVVVDLAPNRAPRSPFPAWGPLAATFSTFSVTNCIVSIVIFVKLQLRYCDVTINVSTMNLQCFTSDFVMFQQ